MCTSQPNGNSKRMLVTKFYLNIHTTQKMCVCLAIIWFPPLYLVKVLMISLSCTIFVYPRAGRKRWADITAHAFFPFVCVSANQPLENWKVFPEAERNTSRLGPLDVHAKSLGRACASPYYICARWIGLLHYLWLQLLAWWNICIFVFYAQSKAQNGPHLCAILPEWVSNRVISCLLG